MNFVAAKLKAWKEQGMMGQIMCAFSQRQISHLYLTKNKMSIIV